MKCPICDGKGGWDENMGEGTVLHEECPFCKSGKISVFEWIVNLAWQNMPDWLIDSFALLAQKREDK